MKKILDQCCDKQSQVVKLRLRGKGSGYKEGPTKQESNEQLHLCVSSKFNNQFQKVQIQFRTHRPVIWLSSCCRRSSRSTNISIVPSGGSPRPCSTRNSRTRANPTLPWSLSTNSPSWCKLREWINLRWDDRREGEQLQLMNIYN